MSTVKKLSVRISLQWIYGKQYINPKATFLTMKTGQTDRNFADDIFKCIFLNENVWISLKFILKVPVDNTQDWLI